MEAKYIITHFGKFIIVTGENSVTSIPCDPNNYEYVAMMALVEEGKLTIEPAEEPK